MANDGNFKITRMPLVNTWVLINLFSKFLMPRDLGSSPSTPMEFIMQSKSAIFRVYTKKHGRENQYFITSYIGISLIKSVDDKPHKLRTSGVPKNIDNAKNESKLFIQKSTLVYCVSNFENFIDKFLFGELLNVNFTYSDKLRNIYSNSNRKSVYQKLQSIINEFPCLVTKEYYLVIAAIYWRNDLVHQTRLKFNSEDKKNLESHRKGYKESYKNLSVDKLIEHYDNNRVPSFKETLSLITSLRNFASQIHNYFMNEVSVDEYVKFILREKYDSGEIKKFTRIGEEGRFWDTVIATHIGLSEEDMSDLKCTDFGIDLYKVQTESDFINLIQKL